MSLLFGIGTPPFPLPQESVPPGTKGGGGTLACGEGGVDRVGVPIPTTGEKA